MLSLAPVLVLLAALHPALAAGKVTGSSVKEDDKGKHTADLAVDGLLSTGWAEGAIGPGDGSWLEVDLGESTKIEELSIWPGNLAAGEDSFKEYSRPKTVRISVDGKQVGDDIRIQDEVQRVDLPISATGKVVRIDVVDVYDGGVYPDLYIAEVAVNFTEGERAKAVEKVDAFRTGKEGTKLAADFEKQVLDAYQKHKDAPDDMDSLGFLIAAAGNGPDYLQKRVTTLVPIGYRAQAIVPDQKSIDAIRKLKDPNGIPGLHMAALRALGKQQKEMLELIEIFQAYAELRGGGRRNIKAWGETGWEVGAIQSFEEPIAVEADRNGSVIIADTGNNRIQRYNAEGVSEKQWGPPADVANDWFGRSRKWYVGGSGASKETGGFMEPIDVEIIPQKESDEYAVLDSNGRIQIFDEDGNVKIGWTVRCDHQMDPGVGGEGYLTWNADKHDLVAFVGDTAVTYTLDSQETQRWTVQDGTPNAVQAGSDGRLYMTFGGKIVAYNADGFRYGVVADSKILGEGFEDLDLTTDEAGRLWALTDTGWVFNFKKPGKLDWKVRISDSPLEHPRFAISQGMAFVTDHDRILHIDALQRHMDEVDAAKNGKGADTDGSKKGAKKGSKDAEGSTGDDGKVKGE